ncbi:hypothetical protein F511_44088 [Dorcoceras hygrometricum]|uniref:Uncharacterized protein n=1 Tax=Dorcoceras hygrometricum TaxID=472368 RepID=A0A2Z7A5W7_9LAMI|nr:hypothetical protein F511_44088 [Dorcoceras hygrometricum]
MAAFFYVNAMQVDFASMLDMEHSGMVRMFKSLEETWLKGFLKASNSVYEGGVTEFLVNAKVISGTIVSFFANRKMALTKDVFIAAFGLPTEGMVGFMDIPKEIVVEMRRRFSGSDVPFRAPSKKKEMKMEFRLLHDIVAKPLCAKAGSFDMVTSEKFDLMVAISADLNVLREDLVKADLGESVNMHPQKVLTSKSVLTGTEGGDSLIAQPVGKEKRVVEKKKKKEKVKVVEKKPEVAGSQAAPKIIVRHQLGRRFIYRNCSSGAHYKEEPDQADLEGVFNYWKSNGVSTWSSPEEHAGGAQGSTASGPEATVTIPPQLEMHAGDVSHIPAQDEHMECGNETSNANEQEEHMEFENQIETECQNGHVATVAQSEHEEFTRAVETRAEQPVENQADDTSIVADKEERMDTARRGPTTIATPKSQFRTDPSDPGKAPSNIAP